MDKQNFEKDIDVPSKNIEYHNDAKDCELAKSSSCCWCKNMSCYQLEQQLKTKEQECKNNKIAHQMELDIYNQECLNLLEELKVKEQECEELKKDNNCFQDRVVKLKLAVLSLTDDNDQLKAENDKLKKRVDELEECEGNDG